MQQDPKLKWQEVEQSEAAQRRELLETQRIEDQLFNEALRKLKSTRNALKKKELAELNERIIAARVIYLNAKKEALKNTNGGQFSKRSSCNHQPSLLGFNST